MRHIRDMSTRTHTAGGVAADDDGVVSWRLQQLRACGFEAALAASIARDCRYDLHGLMALVGRGCAPGVAARILAPLDDESRPC